MANLDPIVNGWFITLMLAHPGTYGGRNLDRVIFDYTKERQAERRAERRSRKAGGRGSAEFYGWMAAEMTGMPYSLLCDQLDIEDTCRVVSLMRSAVWQTAGGDTNANEE